MHYLICHIKWINSWVNLTGKYLWMKVKFLFKKIDIKFRIKFQIKQIINNWKKMSIEITIARFGQWKAYNFCKYITKCYTFIKLLDWTVAAAKITCILTNKLILLRINSYITALILATYFWIPKTFLLDKYG